jgi:hypothetical protein
MPTDVAIIVTGVAVAFLAFAGTLAWADYYARGARQHTGSK